MRLPAGPWLVVGLARSGVAAARALRGAGEEVVAVDAGRPEGVSALDAEVVLGSHGVALLDRVRAVCKSPGVPRSAPVIAEALRRGVPVLGELEVAWRLLPEHPFLVVTGTNGKTTTTELLGAIHREAGLAHAVAGNVGTAASSLVGALEPGAVVVCEASSFQLEDTEELAPDGALLLNLAEDHLDRHGTFEAYVAAKLNAFARQGPEAVAVAPAGFAVPGRARRLDPLPIVDGALQLDGERVEVRLRGPHNLENAAGAAALALARGVDPAAVRAALASFAGVPHRLEEVAERDGVLYVNDSKATNVASTLVALRAFAPRTVHVILGGLGKGQDFTPLRAAVTAAYVIGEDGDAIAAVLEEPARCGTLEAAVAAARERARPGDVILLSPACASFDQFRDYEARGDAFRALAQEA